MLRGWYLQPKHRDATRVARSFLVSTAVRGKEKTEVLFTPLRDALLNCFYICEVKTHPDTMVLTALTQFSCKVGHLFSPIFARATAENLEVLNSLEFQSNLFLVLK